MATPKQVILEAVQALPDDATFEDIEYHLYVRARVEEGLRAADEGRVVSHEEAKRRMAEWRQRARSLVRPSSRRRRDCLRVVP